MPSEARTASVQCLMVRDNIPMRLCDIEQRPDACRGCHAITRRCTNCDKQNGIADAETGLCKKCLAQAGESANNANRISSFEEVLAKASEIGRSKTPLTPTAATTKDQAPLGASPLLQDASVLYYPLLMQHAMERNGEWTVSVPIKVLMRRTHLLPEECKMVLARLVKDGSISGKEPWEIATLLQTRGIEEAKAKVELVGARGQLIGSTNRGQKRTNAKSYGLPRNASNVRRHEANPSRGRGMHRRSTKSEEARETASLQELAMFLKSKAISVNGESLVPGVVPTLQMQFNLRTPEVITALKKLEAHGFLGQKDEWRTIILLRDDAIEEVEEEQPTEKEQGEQEKQEQEPPKVTPAPVTPPTPAPSKPVASPSAKRPTVLSKKRKGPTYAEMFAFLIQKSAQVEKERRTGGALPQLQIRFKLSATEATRTMEWFVANGHIKQRDGWRTVTLLSKAIPSNESPTTNATKAVTKPTKERTAKPAKKEEASVRKAKNNTSTQSPRRKSTRKSNTSEAKTRGRRNARSARTSVAEEKPSSDIVAFRKLVILLGINRAKELIAEVEAMIAKMNE